MAAHDRAVGFEIRARSGSTRARLGRVTTPHGSFETPAFMPVATAATMKGLTPEQVDSTGSEIILNNAYHLMLRPTAERIAQFGGTHEFMRWPKPILTDSGGFQAWSMSDGTKLTEQGVEFRSFIDGSKIMLTPERSIEVQNLIGADIIMAFDDCPPAIASEQPPDDPQLSRKRRSRPEDHAKRVRDGVDRTARWLERCVKAHARPDAQGLFGIIQGGTDLDLRRRSVEQICAHDLPGYAIGGVAVGESPDEIHRTVSAVAPLLPRRPPALPDGGRLRAGHPRRRPRRGRYVRLRASHPKWAQGLCLHRGGRGPNPKRPSHPRPGPPGPRLRLPRLRGGVLPRLSPPPLHGRRDARPHPPERPQHPPLPKVDGGHPGSNPR